MNQKTATLRWLSDDTPWLPVTHPLAVALVQAAEAIDHEKATKGAATASLLNSYRLMVSDCLSLAPTVAPEAVDDDPDGLLDAR